MDYFYLEKMGVKGFEIFVYLRNDALIEFEDDDGWLFVSIMNLLIKNVDNATPSTQ